MQALARSLRDRPDTTTDALLSQSLMPLLRDTANLPALRKLEAARGRAAWSAILFPQGLEEACSGGAVGDSPAGRCACDDSAAAPPLLHCAGLMDVELKEAMASLQDTVRRMMQEDADVQAQVDQLRKAVLRRLRADGHLQGPRVEGEEGGYGSEDQYGYEYDSDGGEEQGVGAGKAVRAAGKRSGRVSVGKGRVRGVYGRKGGSGSARVRGSGGVGGAGATAVQAGVRWSENATGLAVMDDRAARRLTQQVTDDQLGMVSAGVGARVPEPLW